MSTSAPAASIRSRLGVGLGLLALAGGAVVTLGPSIAQRANGTTHPDYAVVALIGLLLIALTSIFLTFVAKVVGLGGAWLLLAVAYNALILAAKFIISPIALYQTTFVHEYVRPDPQNPAFAYFASAATLVLYGTVFIILYRVFRNQANRVLDISTAEAPHAGACASILAVGGCLVGGGLAVTVGGGLYLGAVFAVGGAALVVALAVAFAGAVGSFQLATARTIAMRDTAILSSFMWVGLSLLIFYHVLWVVYAIVLVNMWPLKTVAPSGK